MSFGLSEPRIGDAVRRRGSRVSGILWQALLSLYLMMSARADSPTISAQDFAVQAIVGTVASNRGSYTVPQGDTVASIIADAGTVTDNGSGSWSWSLTGLRPAALQVHVVLATAMGQSASVTFSVAINNEAPQMGNLTFTNGGNGGNYTVEIDGTFADPFDDGPWNGIVDWGDAANESLLFTGQGPFSLSHNYLSVGQYDVKVAIIDQSGASAAKSVRVEAQDLQNVNDPPVGIPPADQRAVEGVGTWVDLGSFSDPYDPGPWELNVDWGDGTYTSDIVKSLSLGLGINHVFQNSGHFSPVVVVRDSVRHEAKVQFGMDVDPAKPRIGVELPAGHVVAKEALVDIGTLVSGVTNVVTLRLWNDGNSPLNLSDIRAFPQNNAIVVSPDLVQGNSWVNPGSEVYFTIGLIPLGVGPVSGEVRIRSNSQGDEEYRVSFRGDSIADMPHRVHLKVSGTVNTPMSARWMGHDLRPGQTVQLRLDLDDSRLAAVTDGAGGMVSTGNAVSGAILQFDGQPQVAWTSGDFDDNRVRLHDAVLVGSDELDVTTVMGAETLQFSLEFSPDLFGQALLVPPFGATPEQVNDAAALRKNAKLVLLVDNANGHELQTVTVDAMTVECSYVPYLGVNQAGWIGGAGGFFSEPRNWLEGRMPEREVDAVFQETGKVGESHLVDLDVPTGILARSLTVRGDGNWTVVGDRSAGPGDFRFSGGDSLVFGGAAVRLTLADPGLLQGFSFDSLAVDDADLTSEAPLTLSGSPGLRVNASGTASLVGNLRGSSRVARGGLLRLNQGEVSGGALVSDGLVLATQEDFKGEFLNRGSLRIDSVAGDGTASSISFTGGAAIYRQSSSGSLYFDVHGSVPGVDHDLIAGREDGGRSAAAVLDGVLHVDIVGPFKVRPLPGAKFFLLKDFHGGISGKFSSVSGLPAGWSVEYEDTNADGLVDAVALKVGATPQIGVIWPGGLSLVSGVSTGFAGNVVFPTCCPKTLVVTVTNSGTAPLHLGAVDVTGPQAAEFLPDLSDLTSPVPPSGATTFKLNFRPLGSRTRSATLRIASDDVFAGQFTATVEGYGNTPPNLGADSVTRFAGRPLKIPASVLLGNDTDADGDSLRIPDAVGVSANGVTVRTAGGWVYYDSGVNTPNLPDSFEYVAEDARGGRSSATVAVSPVAVPVAPPTQNLVSATAAGPGNRNITLVLQGAPKRLYDVWGQSVLGGPWTLLTGAGPVEASGNGRFTVFDPNVANSQTRFYRSQVAP